MKTNQKGFGTIEVIIALVILVLIGATGWFVWDRQRDKDTDASLAASSQESSQDQVDASNQTQTSSSVANWLKYTSQNSKYSMSLPDGWHLTSVDGSDSIIAWDAADITYKNGTSARVDVVEGGRDGSSTAFWLIYDYKSNESFDASYQFARIKKVKTYETDNGVTVNKYTRTQTTEPEGMDIPKGTTEYVYDLSHNGVSILITHDVLTGENDQTQHLEDAIATLKFL